MLTFNDMMDIIMDSGFEQAYNILLLAGHDGYEGDVEEYQALLDYCQSGIVLESNH